MKHKGNENKVRIMFLVYFPFSDSISSYETEAITQFRFIFHWLDSYYYFNFSILAAQPPPGARWMFNLLAFEIFITSFL